MFWTPFFWLPLKIPPPPQKNLEINLQRFFALDVHSIKYGTKTLFQMKTLKWILKETKGKKKQYPRSKI